MKRLSRIIQFGYLVISISSCYAQITPGAYQTDLYLPLLKNKSIGLIVNPTSRIQSTHLVDTLRALQITIKTIFAPEHGFRGDAEAGKKLSNTIDSLTGIPIISLYGATKKPSAEQLADLDILVFDIQDVGVRFYTYISTLHYIMEACAENNKLLIVLDRPNPNGNYIDGPVLENDYKSFVGMHPIPIVHGLTVGELATMINGEKWLKDSMTCLLQVIPIKNYSHRLHYSLPMRPSPNLPNDQSIRLYPSLCLFEGTSLSVGRGTPYPFQVIGSPDFKNKSFSFTPVSIPGVAEHPPYEGQLCYGKDLRHIKPIPPFTLSYIIELYKLTEDKNSFFTPFFEKLVGTKKLREQIQEGWDEKKIRETWSHDLIEYKKIRKKYIIYTDFN